MRAAPPVSVRCDGGRGWHALRAGLPALAAGALAAWALGHAGLPTIVALAVIALVALVAWPLTRQRPLLLAWDSQRWTADGVPGALDVMIDAGAGLLLRLRPDEPPLAPRWVAVTARQAGPALHALRAAAYARPPEVAPASTPDGLRLPR